MLSVITLIVIMLGVITIIVIMLGANAECFVNTNHRYLNKKNRLLKVCYVPITSAASSKAFFFFHNAAAIYRTNEENKAGGTCN
jgi:hypothetical protein